MLKQYTGAAFTGQQEGEAGRKLVGLLPFSSSARGLGGNFSPSLVALA